MRPPRSKSTRSELPAELALVSQIRARAAQSGRRTSQIPGLRSGVGLGIGDDCALLRLRPGEELAVTTDLSIAGRHFELDRHPPEAVGHRTLARGLSDLAAMGARPVAAFLSLGLPRNLAGQWLSRFLDGFFALADATATPLAGGDLAESPIAVADIVLTGAVPRGRALLRSGARPSDLIYVTGTLGGSATALAQLAGSSRRSAAKSSRLQVPRISPRLAEQLAPHLYPQPRIAQGLALVRRRLATAAIDLSDGLSTDLAHLCEESRLRNSRVAAEIESNALPIHPDATLAHALHGGEDYELLFTTSPSTRIPRSLAGVPVTCIGRILRARDSHTAVTLVTADGDRQPLAPQGWQHFSS